jgi:signal transduction histidine kinase
LERGLQQIRTTVAALLPQARIEDRPLEPGDLDDIVTLIQTTVDRQAVQLHTVLEIESALRVPSGPVRQVMLNMLLNALKAAGDKGRIDALLKADAERVLFSVSNSGMPLSLEKLHESLATHNDGDPRGFGLWVCQELANHFGGGFELDRNFSGGTQLIFWLPNREPTESVN